MLRDIKMAPNTAASACPPVVTFITYEQWQKSVPIYAAKSSKSKAKPSARASHPPLTSEGSAEGGGPESTGDLQGMWGSKWNVKWSIPVDIDLKIGYEGSTKLVQTGGSLYVSMSEVVVEATVCFFIEATADGMQAVVVHFEDMPRVDYELSGELRSGNAVAATAKRAMAWTAAHYTGKSEWDHAEEFVREKIVNKLLLEHTGDRAVSYAVHGKTAPRSGGGGERTGDNVMGGGGGGGGGGGASDSEEEATMMATISTDSERREEIDPLDEWEQQQGQRRTPRHYNAGALFRTTTRNVNVVSTSPRSPAKQ